MATASYIDDELRARVYQWAYRVLQDHHDALDATQDVLLRSVDGRVRTATIENRQAWFRQVTVNHCLDLMRKRRRRPIRGGAAADAEPTDPSTETSRRELHQAVVEGLAQLSDHQRAVLVAKVYDRATFAEIARSLGMSVSTAKTHYLRALKALRSPLQKYREYA